jgi:hypothetical protein
MRTALIKHGDGYAIQIDPEMLKRIGATPKTVFELRPCGRGLMLTQVDEPNDPNKPDEDFVKMLGEIEERAIKAVKRTSE